MHSFPFGFCTTTIGVAHSLWSTRVSIPKSSRRCSSLSTASMRLNGTGLGLTNLGTASSCNRSRASTLVQMPNPGAKTVGYLSRTLFRLRSHLSTTLQSMVDGNVVGVLLVEQGININLECLDPVLCENRSTCFSTAINGKV